MLRYLLRRISYVIPILLGVNIITFMLFFMVNSPDNMARMQLGGKNVTPEIIERWKENKGYNLPLFYNKDKSGLATINNTIFYNTSKDLFSFNFGSSDAGRDINYDICKEYVEDVFSVSNERLCHELINQYQNDGIILEPAGGLSLCGLDFIKDKYRKNNKSLENKNIVCILSGSNNDISRYSEIMELNLKYLNLKHYFILQFNQKPKELKRFITKVLGKNDDIVRFEYIKKTNKNYGNVLVGIELKEKEDLNFLLDNLNKYKFKYKKIEEDDLIYDLLI